MTIAIIAIVSVAFLIAIVAVDYEPKKLTPVFLMLFWMPLVALHELGHAITAKLLGWRVCEVVVGYGRKLGTVRLFGIETQFRMIPLEGFVIPAPRDLRGVKWKSALIYLAGPGIEILFVLACLAVLGPDRLFSITENLGVLAVQAACVAAGYGVVSNLIPRTIKSSSGSAANDGMGIASFLTPLADYDQRRATPLVVDLRHLARQERWEEVIAGSAKGLEEFPGNEGLRASRVLALTETARFREARDGLIAIRDDRPVDDDANDGERPGDDRAGFAANRVRTQRTP